MTFLLDTHALLWLLSAPESLPDRVLSLIRDQSSRVLLSLITPWEIAIKAKTGKLDVADMLDDFAAKMTRAKLEIVETTVAQVIRAGGLPLHHRDPFDRLLIAQAAELRVPIVSADQSFDFYEIPRIWE